MYFFADKSVEEIYPILWECIESPPKAIIPLIRLRESGVINVSSLHPFVISSIPNKSALIYGFMFCPFRNV